MALEHLSDVVQRCVSTSGHMRGLCKLLSHLTVETDLSLMGSLFFYCSLI